MSWSNLTTGHGRQQSGEHLEIHRLSSRNSTATHSAYQDSNVFRDSSSQPYTPLNGTAGLGVPKKKAVTDNLDILSLCLAWTCFAAAWTVVAISSVAYRVGYNNQLIVIGLLLSVQLLCFKRIAPTVFARIEERVGGSCLQSFDAILLNSATIDGSGVGWRIVILFLTLLPIGLSAAYKRYAGGFAIATISSVGNYYGLAGPGDLNTLAWNTGQTLMVNATIPFMAATGNLTAFLHDSELPRAFGFNTLVLSNTSTAVLDAPWPSTVSRLQTLLNVNEKFTLTAQVYATVTRYSDLLDQHREPEDPFWQTFPWDQGGWYLYANHCYNGYMVGYRSDFGGPPEPTGGNQSWIMLGPIPSHGDYTNPYSMDSPSYADFNSSAMLFYNKREVCTGTWIISRAAIQLLAGSCDGVELDEAQQQIISNHTMDLTSWYMSLTTEYLCPFTTDQGSQSPWMIPTMATFTATMLWSRMAALVNPSDPFYNQSYYLRTDDILQNTVPARPRRYS